MAGKPGRSGRRPRTAWPTMVSALPQPTSSAWEPSPDELAGLGEAGGRFLRQMLDDSEVTLVQGILLLQAAHTLDALTQWRQEASGDLRKAKLVLAHTATFSNLLAAIRTW